MRGVTTTDAKVVSLSENESAISDSMESPGFERMVCYKVWRQVDVAKMLKKQIWYSRNFISSC